MIRTNIEEIPSKIIKKNLHQHQRRNMLSTKFSWLSKYVSDHIPQPPLKNEECKTLLNIKRKRNNPSLPLDRLQTNVVRQITNVQTSKQLKNSQQRTRFATEPNKPTNPQHIPSPSLLFHNINPNRSFTFLSGKFPILALKNKTNIITYKDKPKVKDRHSLSNMDDMLSPWTHHNESTDNNKENILQIF